MIALDRKNPDHRLVIDLTAAAMSMAHNPSVEGAATDILNAQEAVLARMPKTLETDFDCRERIRPGSDSRGGIVRFMSRASGYVMVRRPGCLPFVMAEKDWLTLPLAESQK